MTNSDSNSTCGTQYHSAVNISVNAESLKSESDVAEFLESATFTTLIRQQKVLSV